MAVVLLQVLERTELNKLPKGVQNKIEKFITELQSANDALDTQYERFKADCEQQYFDVEKRLVDSQEHILSTAKDLETVKEQNKRLNEELSTLKGIEGESSEDKPAQQSKAKYEIEAERRELARLLEKRSQEVENLTAETKQLSEKLTETNKVKMELQLKLDEIQSSETSVQHREKRMEQEKELLQQAKEWLTAELKTKTGELLRTSRETGKELLDLRSSLDSSQEQVTSLETQLAALKETSGSHQRRAEDLNNKLKQSKDQQFAMEEKYRNELNAHIKLSSLYKGAASDAEGKNHELNRAVEELSKLLTDTSEANKALEKKVSEGEELKVRLEAELIEKLKKLEKDLENATVKAADTQCCVPSLTKEQLHSLCPSAAAVAEIVKPGMKFFELYNAYTECQTQLQLERQETRRVTRVLDDIVQEVESKAPVLRRQREEYEGMQRAMASLCSKLEQARAEIHSLQKERDEAQQRCSAAGREKLRMERLLEDTSTQVCSLLVDLEEARGHRVARDDGGDVNLVKDDDDNKKNDGERCGDMCDPSPVVTFHSVEDLQRHNQSMLGQLRLLEEERDRRQSQVTSGRVCELEASVEQLQKQVEQLREQRDQHKQLADSSGRQRDMYRILLSQSTGFSLPPQPGPEAPSSQPARGPLPRFAPQRAATADVPQTTQAKAALKQLNDSFMLYKKEKAENDRLMNETNERLQKQLTELRSSKAKMASQLEFNSKRYDMLQETVSAYHREITALQEKSTKMSATIQSQEDIIHTMAHDLRQANEKLALEEVRMENLTKERDMLRQAESRLGQEKEAVLTEQRNQSLLLANLKSIQLAMERTETETRLRLSGKVAGLEAELVAMKTKLDQELERRHALGRNMDAQLLEAKKQLETQNTLQQKTRDLLRSSEQQVASLRAQLASASESFVSTTTASTPVTRAAGLRAPPRGTPPPSPAQPEGELSEVRGRLRAAEERGGELEEQLRSTSGNVERYKALVLSLEDCLKKERLAQAFLEARLKEAQEVQRQLELRVLEVEKQRQQEVEERKKALDAVEKQVCELQRALKASQTDQQEALERAAAAVTQEQKATLDSLLQAKLAGEAQAKYERELMLHAADVEALQELKRHSQQGAARCRDLEQQLSRSTAQLQEKTAALAALERCLKEDLSNQSRRCEELAKQNALLHQQMDDMANTGKQQQQQHQQLNLSFSEEGKTTEQILEIVRFVRREKDIALTRCEASEGEALRYRQRMEHQDLELKDLQETLNQERDKMQTAARTLALQEERLRRSEDTAALQDVVRSLKMDRERLEKELQQSMAKVSKLQADIGPLQNALSQQSERGSSLQAEKKILEDELKRWKAKAQQMASQQKDSDVEERQKLASEREAQQKRISQLMEEASKLKAELARANASGSAAQTQLQALRDSVGRVTAERDGARKDLEAKVHDILEKNKTITQVKKIGRRYKTQYEELKLQHDKLVSEAEAKAGPSQEAQEELAKAREEVQKKQEEAQKAQQELEEARKENQKTKDLLQEVQTQQAQNQNQVQSQLNQAQTQLQQHQNQLTQCQKELQQAKSHSQQLQTQLKVSQGQAQVRQRELQQAHSQELGSVRTSLTQADSKVTELQGQLDGLQKTVVERDVAIGRLQEQLAEASQASQGSQAATTSDTGAPGDASQALQEELAKLRQEVLERSGLEEQLRQQMADKDEKTKKLMVAAKSKITQINSTKEQLSREVEELRQHREEQEVRLNALRSQYDGRLLRLDRELRELKEAQAHADPRDESPEQGSGSKVGDQPRSTDPRQVSLKSPAQDRASSGMSDPPTANIRPTPGAPSPGNKPSPSPGNKATPRASIRPMVTPATVSTQTPTATVMPTTQADSQETLVTVSSVGATPPSAAQPTSCQATAFVQPTQQQAPSQEPEAERPSTSSTLIGPGVSPGHKRGREEEEEEEVPEGTPSLLEPPLNKRVRIRQAVTLQEEPAEAMEGEMEEVRETQQDNQENLAGVFPVLGEDDQGFGGEEVGSTQPTLISHPSRHIIVIDTDSESRESRVEEEEEEEEEEDKDEGEEDNEEYKDDEDPGNGVIMADGSRSESREVEQEEEEDGEGEGRGEGNDEQGEPEAGRDESPCAADSSDPSQSGEGSSGASSEAEHPREPPHILPSLTPSLHPRLPQPRRPPHPLPPRLYIQPPAPDLGPPHTQRQSSQLRRQSAGSGRGPQLTPGIVGMQHFFDDDDRMVPSTPTLVVPHRTDGFAEAIHSPQVAGISTRFRFGPLDDMLTHTSALHSDLGQLASQGGLGMYESPLFLAAHDEEGGGRSVPTTPLQVAAPVNVFAESLPADSGDNMASQSVPMVTAAASGIVVATDDGDEVFMEGEGSSMEPPPEGDPSAPQSDDASLPSTSQDPDTSSATQRRPLSGQPQTSSLTGRGVASRAGRGLIRRDRGAFSRAGRGGAMGRGSVP